MKRRSSAAVAATALALAGALGLATPAQAHQAVAPVRYEVRPLAASAGSLVYARAVRSAKGRPTSGGIYVRSLHGKAHRLATAEHISSATAAIAGSMVVLDADPQAVAPDRSALRWKDLATGAHGTVPGTQTITIADGTEATASYVAPAPNGWILESAVPGADHLYLQRPDGTTTDLGAPEPGGDPLDPADGTDVSDDLVVRTSATALVVTTGASDGAYDNGSASVMSFAHPGRFTRFIGFGHEPVCAVTERRIACDLDDLKTGTRLYSIAGQRLITTTGARGRAHVVGSALAAFSARRPHNVLSIKRASGTIRVAEGPVVSAGPSGLGGLVITRGRITWWAKQLVLVTSDGHERTLVSER